MSGFYGEWALTGARPDPKNIAAMAAVQGGGPDGGGEWLEGRIAMGAHLLRITSEDALEVQPLIEPDLVLVGHVRLDGRAELGHALGLNVAQMATLPDSRLVALAWRRWGEACVDYLLGDWVFAIWDRVRSTLWLARDAAGNTALYYWQDARRLVFATSLPVLLAHRAVPRQPYPYHVARQLAVVMDAREDSATAFLGIQRLPGGHALRLEHGGMKAYGWWRPETLDEFDWKRDDEYYEAFRSLYSSAVTDRLRGEDGPVGLMLSAGLDSGTVAALAAPRLAAEGRPLLAYTAVPYFAPDGASTHRLGDESQLARSAAEHIGLIDFHPMDSHETSILDAIEAMLAITGLPGHAAVNQYWIFDILQRAQADGVKVLLTGQGGNATVSWAGVGNLWPAVRAGDGAALVAAFRESESGLWPTVKRQLLKPLLGPVRDSLKRWGYPRDAPWEHYSALHPALAGEVDLDRRMRAAGHDSAFGGGSTPRDSRLARFRLGRLGSAGLGSIWMAYGTAHQLAVRDPTRDRRLIEFCWRVPDRIFWAGGLQRGLIIKGLTGCLPAAVLHARRKGLQAADIGCRVLAERERIEAALDRLEAHYLANAWLDVPKMRRVLAALAHGVNPSNTAQTVSILLRGLGVGLFLTQF
jgi:asparagine synthase (glutamine-hydrolysing)